MYATTFSATPGTGHRTSGHDSDHGFCSVCGAVWPCSRARRELAAIGAAALIAD